MGTFINQVQRNNALQQDIFNFQKKDKQKQENIKYNKLFNKYVLNNWEVFIQKLVLKVGEKVYTFDFEEVFEFFIEKLLNKKETKDLMRNYDKEYLETQFNGIETRLKCRKLFYSNIKKNLKLKEEIEKAKEEKYNKQLKKEKEKIYKYIKKHNLLKQENKKDTTTIDITDILKKHGLV